MKRLLSVAIIVLMSLVGMVGFSRAAELQNIQQSRCQVIECIEVSALQSTINPITGAVNELLETEYDLDTLLDWETVYAWEKVYARVPAKAKMYYLTVASFTGGDAITACDTGFHMASIPEIQDSSNRQYDTIRSTPAYDEPSYYQGFGPPSDHMGWVRTGSFPLLAGVPDYSDFSMSSFDQQSGTTMSLHTQVWEDSYMDPYPEDTETGWHLKQIAYNSPQQVWCVEDPE
jgi:hypothetical protein